MSAQSIRVLVPSSERKRDGGSRAFTFNEAQEERSLNRFPSLRRDRLEALAAFLSAVNGKGFAAEVLRLKAPALEAAAATNLAFHRSALLPALRRESGPLFAALRGAGTDVEESDDESLGLESSVDPATMKRLREDLVIVCPLLGLLAPTDLVPEYRCPVGAQIPEWGSLHAFWKPRVTPVLNRLCRGRRVFSFLPLRLEALWTLDARVIDLISVEFVRRSGGATYPEHAGSGRLSGELARHIFAAGISTKEALCEHVLASGHRYAPELSSTEGKKSIVVFARTV